MWRILQWAARLFMGALFIYAGYQKLREPFLFEIAVDSYQLLPPWGVILTARILPWLEIALGVVLLSGWKLRYFATFAAALIGFFLALMAISYSRGVEATCGCFGFGEKVSPRTLLRDGVLFVIVAFLAISAWKEGLGRRRLAGATAGSEAAASR